MKAFFLILMTIGFLTLAVVSTTSTATAANKTANAAAKTKTLATDSEHCEILYSDIAGERSLKRKCPKQKTETRYFAMDDTSAPLLEGRMFKVGSENFLATRWGTGKSEEVILFDLAANSAKITDRLISDGPSSVAMDTSKKKIKLQMTERVQKEDTVTASTKTVYWPSHL